MHSAYQCTIKFSAVNGLANVFNLLATQLTGLHKKTEDLDVKTKKLTKSTQIYGRTGVSANARIHAQMLKNQIALDNHLKTVEKIKKAMVGIAFTGLGFAGFDVLKKLSKSGDELTKQLSLLKVSGFTDKQQKDTFEAARKTSILVPGTTTSGNISDISETAKIFGNQEQGVSNAIQLSPFFAQMKLMASTMGENADHMVQNLVKAMEIRLGAKEYNKDGTLNSDLVKNELGMMVKGLIASKGQVTSDQFKLAVMQGGLSMQKYATAQDFMANVLSKIEEVGGNRAGTMTAAMMRDITMINGSKERKELLVKLGVAEKKGKKYNFNEGFEKFRNEHNVDESGELIRDRLLKLGNYKSINDDGAQQYLNNQAQILGNKETAKRFMQFLNNPEQKANLRDWLEKTPDMHTAFIETYKNNIVAMKEATGAISKNLDELIGNRINQRLLPVLYNFNIKFSKFVDAITDPKNADLLDNIINRIIYISAGFLAVGGIILGKLAATGIVSVLKTIGTVFGVAFDAISLLFNPITIVVGLLILLGNQIPAIHNFFQDLKDSVMLLFNGDIKGAQDKFLKSDVVTGLGLIYTKFSEQLTLINTAWTDFGKDFKTGFKSVFDSILDGIDPIYKKITGHSLRNDDKKNEKAKYNNNEYNLDNDGISSPKYWYEYKHHMLKGNKIGERPLPPPLFPENHLKNSSDREKIDYKMSRYSWLKTNENDLTPDEKRELLVLAKSLQQSSELLKTNEESKNNQKVISDTIEGLKALYSKEFTITNNIVLDGNVIQSNITKQVFNQLTDAPTSPSVNNVRAGPISSPAHNAYGMY